MRRTCVTTVGSAYGRTRQRATGSAEHRIVTVLAEPIGTRRMDHVTLFDMRVEKAFALGAGRRLSAFVDGFNLLNANPRAEHQLGVGKVPGAARRRAAADRADRSEVRLVISRTCGNECMTSFGSSSRPRPGTGRMRSVRDVTQRSETLHHIARRG